MGVDVSGNSGLHENACQKQYGYQAVDMKKGNIDAGQVVGTHQAMFND